MGRESVGCVFQLFVGDVNVSGREYKCVQVAGEEHGRQVMEDTCSLPRINDRWEEKQVKKKGEMIVFIDR